MLVAFHQTVKDELPSNCNRMTIFKCIDDTTSNPYAAPYHKRCGEVAHRRLPTTIGNRHLLHPNFLFRCPSFSAAHDATKGGGYRWMREADDRHHLDRWRSHRDGGTPTSRKSWQS
jgi:hypothetical protein